MIAQKIASRFSVALAVALAGAVTATSLHAQQASSATDSAATPGAARPTVTLTVEERLAKLEEEIVTLRQENQQLRARVGMGAVVTPSETSDSSSAPSAAASLKADQEQKAADAAAAAAVVGAKPTEKKPEPGINISAITPPKSEHPTGPTKEASESLLASVAPTPSIIKPAGTEQVLSVGGFVQFQGEAGDPIDSRFKSINGTTDDDQNDRLYLRRARIVLGGHFAEDFDFKISAEMSGSLSETTAAQNSMRAQLADGYISWTRYSALNLTVGQFKTSYGYEFLSNDLTIYPVEHALATDALTLGRQIGGQASGTFFRSRLNYTVGAFNGNGVNSNVNDNNSFLYVGRITFAPIKEHIPILGWDTIWTFGVDGYSSKDSGIQLPNYLPTTSTFTGKRSGYGIDTQVLVGPWDIWFEYINTQFDPDTTVLANGIKKKTTADGWYLQGAYSIVPKKWQLLLRYDTFNPDTSALDNETTTWTLGINYLIKGDDLKLMLDYMTSSPFYYIKDATNNNDNSGGHAQRLLLRLQAAF